MKRKAKRRGLWIGVVVVIAGVAAFAMWRSTQPRIVLRDQSGWYLEDSPTHQVLENNCVVSNDTQRFHFNVIRTRGGLDNLPYHLIDMFIVEKSTPVQFIDGMRLKISIDGKTNSCPITVAPPRPGTDGKHVVASVPADWVREIAHAREVFVAVPSDIGPLTVRLRPSNIAGVRAFSERFIKPGEQGAVVGGNPHLPPR